MGNKPSIGGIEAPASGNNGAAGGGSKEGGGSKMNRQKVVREKSRYGAVIVKVASLSSNRRQQERQSTFTITPRGGLFHGTQCNPALVQKALQSTGYPCLPPAEISLGDSRAHKLLIIHSNGWYAIPAPETFSRHSGTCIILGDRNNAGLPFPIKLGDCFRLGSVGLVVSELRTADGDEQRLDSRMLQYLKDEALAFDTNDELAALAAEEGSMFQETQAAEASQMPGADRESRMGIANGERFICYMCYETHDTPDDPLVAPCECRGDTRYLHVQCLQKWYHSSVCGPQARVIRTTGNGAPACKICGTAYKTTFKKADGRISSLLEMESKGPYLSLVVVTRHDTNPGLFNTKFRLNFGRMPNSPLDDPNDPVSQPNALVIGRSSSCSMVLDYRTVSTVHAIIFYSDGQFFLQDRRSSNGTMVYLQEPLELPYSHPLRLRMGRSTLTIQAKRNWVSTMRGVFGSGRNGPIQHPTPQELLQALSQSGVNGAAAGGGGPTIAGPPGAAVTGAATTTSGSAHGDNAGAAAGGGGGSVSGDAGQRGDTGGRASLASQQKRSANTSAVLADHVAGTSAVIGANLEGNSGGSVPGSGNISRVESRNHNAQSMAAVADGQAALNQGADEEERKAAANGNGRTRSPANEAAAVKGPAIRMKVSSNRVAPEEGAGTVAGKNVFEDKKAAVQDYAETVPARGGAAAGGGIVIGDGGAADIEGSAALKTGGTGADATAIDIDAPAAGQFASPNGRPHTPGSRPGSAPLPLQDVDREEGSPMQSSQPRHVSPVAPTSSSQAQRNQSGGSGNLFSSLAKDKDRGERDRDKESPRAAPTAGASTAGAPGPKNGATSSASTNTAPSPGAMMGNTKKVAPESTGDRGAGTGVGSRKNSSNAVTPLGSGGGGGGNSTSEVKKPKAGAAAGGATTAVDNDAEDDAQTVDGENDPDGDQVSRVPSRGTSRKSKGEGADAGGGGSGAGSGGQQSGAMRVEASGRTIIADDESTRASQQPVRAAADAASSAPSTDRQGAGGSGGGSSGGSKAANAAAGASAGGDGLDDPHKDADDK